MISQRIADAEELPVEEPSSRLIEYALALVAIVAAGILSLAR